MFRVLVFAFVSLSAIRGKGDTSIDLYGNGYLPPMAYMDKVPRGFGVEIVQKVMEEAGIRHRLFLVPWQRAYQFGLDSQGFVFGMYKTPEREKLFLFSEAVWKEEIVVVSLKSKKLSYGKLSDLDGLSVGMQSKTRPGKAFESAVIQKKFKRVVDTNPTLRLKRLSAGRVDFALFNPGLASVAWHAKNADLNLDIFTIHKTPVAEEYKYISVSRKHKQKAYLQKINQAILSLKKRNEISKIMANYNS